MCEETVTFFRVTSPWPDERYRLTPDGRILRSIGGRLVPYIAERDAEDFLEVMRQCLKAPPN